MKRKINRKRVNWDGNDGWFYPDPGEVQGVECDICGSEMDVERNVLDSTSLAESMAHSKHLHDSFRCPNLEKNWHKKVIELRSEIRSTASEKIKKILISEVIEILEANTNFKWTA